MAGADHNPLNRWQDISVRRTELACPAHSLRMMTKAAASEADEVIFDLEDGCALLGASISRRQSSPVGRDGGVRGLDFRFGWSPPQPVGLSVRRCRCTVGNHDGHNDSCCCITPRTARPRTSGAGRRRPRERVSRGPGQSPGGIRGTARFESFHPGSPSTVECR